MMAQSNIKLLKVNLKGVNLNRVYKECKKNDIDMFDIDRKDYKNITFFIDKSNKQKLKKIAEQQRYEINFDKDFGAIKLKSSALLHVGLFIGAIIFVLANIFSNMFIWQIKIYGNSNVSNDDILSVLSKNDICVGKKIDAQALDGIEEQLTSQIDDISLCSVIKKGSTIIVNVREKSQTESLQSIFQGKDIVATKNLTITNIVVSNGTALKKAGDSVKAGEVIVAGYVLDSGGNKVSCKANAKISAKTWYSCTEEYPKIATVSTRTGNKIQTRQMQFLGAKSNIVCPKVSFLQYETETKVTTLKNNFLPLKIITTTYYEIITSQVEQNFEQDKQAVTERCQKKAFENVLSTDVVTNVFDVVTETDSAYIVTSYVEVTFDL